MRRVVGFALFSVLSGLSSAQTTWYVDQAGVPPGSGTLNDPYTRIQFAIDRPTTLPGDTLRVAPGTYVGNVDFQGKSLRLWAPFGADQTVLDGAGSGSVVTIANGEGAGTWIDGFTITNGAGTLFEGLLRGGGLFLDGTTVLLTNSRIEANTAESGAGAVRERRVDHGELHDHRREPDSVRRVRRPRAPRRGALSASRERARCGEADRRRQQRRRRRRRRRGHRLVDARLDGRGDSKQHGRALRQAGLRRGALGDLVDRQSQHRYRRAQHGAVRHDRRWTRADVLQRVADALHVRGERRRPRRAESRGLWRPCRRAVPALVAHALGRQLHVPEELGRLVRRRRRCGRELVHELFVQREPSRVRRGRDGRQLHRLLVHAEQRDVVLGQLPQRRGRALRDARRLHGSVQRSDRSGRGRGTVHRDRLRDLRQRGVPRRRVLAGGRRERVRARPLHAARQSRSPAMAERRRFRGAASGAVRRRSA